MKKLYTVEVSYTVVVFAENEHEAENVASESGADVLPDSVLASAFYLPYGWDKDCLPFGDQDGDDELTIGELIAKGAV